MKAAGLFICMAICTQVFAATYYVDFVGGSDANAGTSKAAPWKCAPGMQGFKGDYTHAAGDQFIFKGGVTWPKSVLPLVVGYSGAAGAVDVYGGEDLTWYAGKSWSQPVFDGQQLSGRSGWLIGDNGQLRSFVKIDNLFVENSGNAETGKHNGSNAAATLTDTAKNWAADHWVKYSLYNTSDGSHCQVTANTATTATCALAKGKNNAWSAGDAYVITDGSGTAISFSGGGSYIEISHCTLQPRSVQSIAYANEYAAKGTTSTHILIHDNDISMGGRFVVYGWTGTVVDDVRVYHNRMQGSGGTPLGGYHLDGLMIGNPTSDCAKLPAGRPLVLTPTVTHISFHDNYFYGDWPGGPTALYFSSSCTNYTTIYNNVFALETVDPNYVGYIMRWQSHDGNISILNNTISSDGNPGFDKGATGAMLIYGTYQPMFGALVIKNNIFSGFGLDITGITPSQWSSIDIDYNLHYQSAAGGRHHIIQIGSADCDTLACAESHWGYEQHAPAMGAPQFVSVPNGNVESGNFHLRAGSPAVGKGVNLSSIFTTDAAGHPRPGKGAWDMGAFVAGTGKDFPK
jgi:hypothetical protein